MKKIEIIIAVASAMLLAASCAQSETVGKNDVAERSLNAWVTYQKTLHPEYKWEQTELGSWILEETVGSGAETGDPDDFPYIRYEITTYDLKGNITSTTSEALARKLNQYSATKFYGPSISYRAGNGLYAGVEELVSRMKVGGSVKALIPGWLLTYKRYSYAEDYKNKVSGTDAIYEFRIVDSISDISGWEIDSLGRYISANTALDPVSDSLKYGFYYIRTGAPSTEETLPSDTTVYLNYTGRLLNGKVFDTTIADTAKVHGLYSASKTYAPVQINMAAEYTDITMTSSNSSVKPGFSYAVSLMKAYEKGTAIFWSGLGYAESGVGNSIPAWSPLIFELELTDKK